MLPSLLPLYVQTSVEIYTNKLHPNLLLLILHPEFKQGRVAEWLGRGLQNLVQRFESALDLQIFIIKLKNIDMAVTRLKRKDRRNKTFAKLDVKNLKLATNIELGSRSQQPKKDQLAKNNLLLDQLSAALRA